MCRRSSIASFNFLFVGSKTAKNISAKKAPTISKNMLENMAPSRKYVTAKPKHSSGTARVEKKTRSSVHIIRTNGKRW